MHLNRSEQEIILCKCDKSMNWCDNQKVIDPNYFFKIQYMIISNHRQDIKLINKL